MDARSQLAPAWRRLLGCEGMITGVLDVLNGSSARNLLVWEGCIRPEFEGQTEIYHGIMQLFIEQHRGFLWKEMIASQMESVQRMQWTLATGGLWWNPEEGRYVEFPEKDAEQTIKQPHIFGVTRDFEFRRPGSWVGALFKYHPPRCGFSQSEQQLLLAALNGATDEEVSELLGVSLPTIKKTWLSVYTRVGARLPELLRDQSTADDLKSQRGKEKKRHLLAYLREYPEELRPVSRSPRNAG